MNKPDYFAEIRDKRMGELNPRQERLATELWLRQQIGPSSGYWYSHVKALLDTIDGLRSELEFSAAVFQRLEQVNQLRKDMRADGKPTSEALMEGSLLDLIQQGLNSTRSYRS